MDDRRQAPKGYFWCHSVNEAMKVIMDFEIMLGMSNKPHYYEIELLDLDHDAGDFAADGGDYIRLLDWLEATGRSYPIRIHSQNPVGVQNMRLIIERNGWKEVR